MLECVYEIRFEDGNTLFFMAPFSLTIRNFATTSTYSANLNRKPNSLPIQGAVVA